MSRILEDDNGCRVAFMTFHEWQAVLYHGLAFDAHLSLMVMLNMSNEVTSLGWQ